MKAVVYSIAPFDATDTSTAHVIKFKWQGAAIQMNRCIIKTNDEQETVVYDKTVTSMRYEHEIDMFHSSYHLENGNTYLVYILVSTDKETWSEMSAPNAFLLCLTKPVLRFTNVEQSIYVTAYTFELSYSQEQGELLESFEMDLYDASMSRVKTSGKRYVGTDTALEYTFTELANNSTYYIRGTGKTVNGFDADTGYVPFTVIYDYPSRFSFIDVTNQACYGGIKIRTNFVWIDHQLYDKDGKPIEDEEWKYVPLPNDDNAIDLKEGKLIYKGGFRFDEDWSFLMICANLPVNESILTFSAEDDPNTVANLVYREGRNGESYYNGHFELVVSTNINGKDWNRIYMSNNLPHYVWEDYVSHTLDMMPGKIVSNLPDGNAMDKWYGVHIRHLNGLYSVYCTVVSKNDV